MFTFISQSLFGVLIRLVVVENACIMFPLQLIMVFGYNIRLFHIFGIEEAPRQPGGGVIRQLADLERDQQIQDRDAQIHALQTDIQAQRERTQAIEGEREVLEGENLELKEKLKKLVSVPLWS